MMQEEGRQGSEDVGSLVELIHQWAVLPPEHLKIAVAAVNKERDRQAELEKLRIKSEERREVTGQVLGGLTVGGWLFATVWLAVNDQPVIAGIFAGTGMVALTVIVSIFVLKRSPSTDDLKIISRSKVPQQPPQAPPAAPASAVPPPADPVAITPP
ncbi:hypothetical protein ACWCYY_19280 [Kitasatospora sp. NPDC001664]